MISTQIPGELKFMKLIAKPLPVLHSFKRTPFKLSKQMRVFPFFFFYIRSRKCKMKLLMSFQEHAVFLF